MANGYFERGEMYDILFGDGFAGEMAAHRPGIIVSSDAGNRTNPSVLVVYATTTTTTNKRIGINHFFTMNGVDGYALCNQIATISKNRLKKFHGKLSDSDMKAIDGCLEEALDLGYIDDTAVKEKEKEISVLNIQIKELHEEIEELRKQIAARTDEDAAKKVEIEMWQRLYEKALDQVCSMKLTHDVGRRTAEKPVERTPEPPKKPAPVKKQEPELVDINSARFTELKRCGLSDNIVASIINKRPHKTVEDIKGIAGMTATMYQIVSGKLCCLVPEKPVVEEAPAPVKKEPDTGVESEKVNVNTATAQEICDITGMSLTACFAITGKRKKHGRYTSLDELVIPGRLSQKVLDKYRDKMEV